MLARGMLEKERRLPFVTTLHGTDITLVGVDRSYFPITKYSIEQSDGVTAISENLRQHTVEVFGVKNPIEVIHNFVCISTYFPQPEKLAARKTMLHISNFRPVKRVLDCIRILAEVRQSVDADLWMIGDGPDRGACERLTSELGLIGHVRFLGKQNNIPALLPQGHVLLLPSESESFGLAALEAMACGVVPVATRVGGVPELIDDGVTGFLRGVGDVPAQAECATKLLADDGLRDRMSAAARHVAEQRFNTDLIIPRYEQLYHQVLG